MSIVIELQGDNLYYIGLTDGVRDTFYYCTDTLRAAHECAQYLKRTVEGIIDQRKLN